MKIIAIVFIILITLAFLNMNAEWYLAVSCFVLAELILAACIINNLRKELKNDTN